MNKLIPNEAQYSETSRRIIEEWVEEGLLVCKEKKLVKKWENQEEITKYKREIAELKRTIDRMQQQKILAKIEEMTENHTKLYGNIKSIVCNNYCAAPRRQCGLCRLNQYFEAIILINDGMKPADALIYTETQIARTLRRINIEHNGHEYQLG